MLGLSSRIPFGSTDPLQDLRVSSVDAFFLRIKQLKRG